MWGIKKFGVMGFLLSVCMAVGAPAAMADTYTYAADGRVTQDEKDASTSSSISFDIVDGSGAVVDTQIATMYHYVGDGTNNIGSGDLYFGFVFPLTANDTHYGSTAKDEYGWQLDRKFSQIVGSDYIQVTIEGGILFADVDALAKYMYDRQEAPEDSVYHTSGVTDGKTPTVPSGFEDVKQGDGDTHAVNADGDPYYGTYQDVVAVGTSFDWNVNHSGWFDISSNPLDHSPTTEDKEDNLDMEWIDHAIYEIIIDGSLLENEAGVHPELFYTEGAVKLAHLSPYKESTSVVPEPASFILFGSVLGGAAFIRRRFGRNKKRS